MSEKIVMPKLPPVTKIPIRGWDGIKRTVKGAK